MGYRNIEPYLEHIDNLAQDCGLFFIGEENGGHCCKSKSKLKDEEGRCYAFACPLAVEADLEDMKKYDEDVYREWKEHEDKTGHSPEGSGAGYVIVYKEILRGGAKKEG